MEIAVARDEEVPNSEAATAAIGVCEMGTDRFTQRTRPKLRDETKRQTETVTKLGPKRDQ